MKGWISKASWSDGEIEALFLTLDEMRTEDSSASRKEETIGSRKARVQQMLCDEMLVPDILSHHSRGGPLRFLSHWFLMASTTRTASAKVKRKLERFSHPPVCDLVNPSYSPIVVAQQYYARIIRRRSDWTNVLQSFRP